MRTGIVLPDLTEERDESLTPPSVAASSLRGTLTLFNWGPGFYGFCYNGREGHPNDDPPWVACATIGRKR
jgi:hypothetical protein